jgi:hypothetical protein
MVIYIDSLRRVIIQEGSVSDNAKVKKVDRKTLLLFVKWFFGWLPDDCLKKLGTDDDNTEEDDRNQEDSV